MFPIPFNFPFRKKDGSVTTIDAAISGGGTPYTLPTASATVKGGVKIGNNLSMDGDTLNASGGGTIDTDNMKYIVGRVGDYEYYADLKRTYVGDAATGYEISTAADSSATHAKIDIYAIAYTDEVISKELITTLVHDGANTYSDDNISVSYGGGSPSIGWNVNTLETLYKTDGTTWDSFTTWAYNTNVDYIFLTSSPV